MILHPLESNIANLLNSDAAVAICQAEGERLKSLILLVRDAGWGLVLETASGDHYVIATAHRTQEGNLVGDIRRWNREYGYQFALKPDEQISAPKENILMLPDGRVVEIRRTFTIALGFTHWALSDRENIPAGYVRL
jgi:hypothetical protein